MCKKKSCANHVHCEEGEYFFSVSLMYKKYIFFNVLALPSFSPERCCTDYLFFKVIKPSATLLHDQSFFRDVSALEVTTCNETGLSLFIVKK